MPARTRRPTPPATTGSSATASRRAASPAARRGRPSPATTGSPVAWTRATRQPMPARTRRPTPPATTGSSATASRRAASPAARRGPHSPATTEMPAPWTRVTRRRKPAPTTPWTRSSTRSTPTGSCSRSIPASSAAPALQGDWHARLQPGAAAPGWSGSVTPTRALRRPHPGRPRPLCERGAVQRVHRGRVVQPDVVRTAPGRGPDVGSLRDGVRDRWSRRGRRAAVDRRRERGREPRRAGTDRPGDPPRLVDRRNPGNG